MKNIFSIVSVSLLVLLGACSKKVDEAFVNPNADVRKPVEQLLPGIIANMVTSFASAGTGYGIQNDGLYVGRYVQYWATSTTLNQYDRMGGATGASDILGSIWASHYFGQGQNLNRMVEWGTEDEKWDYVGVGYAIRAWSWLLLTEMHGEVILKQAFNTSQLVFNYDDQPAVYEEVRRIARLALDNLNRTDGKVSETNLAIGDQFMNGGKIDRWKKFVYGVLARSFHHLTNKANYNADSVIYFANLAAATNADNTSMKWSAAAGTGTFSYYSPFRGNIGTLRQSRFIADLLSGANTAWPDVMDPRAPYLIRDNPNGTYKGVRPNKGVDGLAAADQPKNFWGGTFGSTAAPTVDTACRYIFKNAPIWPIMTASEMQFIKAEAYYRSNRKTEARAAFIAGINLNFDQLISDYQTGITPDRQLTAASRNVYLSTASIAPPAASLTLTHIMLQKYIAMYGWGMNETWVDMRRYHYTDKENGLQVYRDFAPPSGTDLWLDNNGNLVYRARPRYNSEYLYNVTELQRIGATALDYNTKKQWFSEP